MNNDKFNRLKDSYFSGTSNQEEEKWLKEKSGDAYFNVLKEEKSNEMDWDFDAFLEHVEEQETTQKAGVFRFRKVVYWAAASVVLVIVCSLLFLQNDTAHQVPMAKNVKPVTQPEETSEPKEEVITPIQVATVERPVAKKTVKKPQHKKTPFSDETTYHPEYVVINGKPIYDLEEAKQLTLSSLNMLTNNVEKSVSTMENVKYLSIKI